MRNLGLFFGLISIALAGSARAQDETPAPAPASDAAAPSAEAAPAPTAAPAVAAAEESRIQVGIAFLPMFLGSLTAGSSGDTSSYDMSPAYGIGISGSYRIIAGLSAGLAPQFLFHVKGKRDSDSAMEYDILARIAYAYTVIPKLAVYAEVLPGYSIISMPSSFTLSTRKPDSPKGFLIGFGGGATYDVTDQVFVNLGVGYQIGFQKTTDPEQKLGYDSKTKFLRVAVGGGMKF